MNYRWPDLAKKFERSLIDQFGFSEQDIAPYRAMNMFKAPEVGSEDRTRLLVG
jgi:hypothetical protein